MLETDPLVTLRERVRERLHALIEANWSEGEHAVTEAILREFRLQPVAWGRVTEDGRLN